MTVLSTLTRPQREAVLRRISSFNRAQVSYKLQLKLKDIAKKVFHVLLRFMLMLNAYIQYDTSKNVMVVKLTCRYDFVIICIIYGK